jgi:hypothetical protein
MGKEAIAADHSKEEEPTPHHLDMSVYNNQLIERSGYLELECAAARSSLFEFLKQKRECYDAAFFEERKRRVAVLRKKATDLLYLYERLIQSPEKAREFNNILLLCNIVIDSKRQFVASEEKKIVLSETHDITTRICDATRQINWWRLLGIRLKRAFETLAPLVKAINGYQGLDDAVREIAHINPMLSYVAWLYYIPRLLVNVLLLLKHTLSGFWMNEDESHLKWQKRLKAQWAARWFEILNDSVWCAVGLLNCFLLSSPQGMLLTVALYLFDVAMALVNAKIQHQKYNHLIRLVDKQIKRKNEFDLTSDIDELKSFRESLLSWKAYEKERLMQSVLVTVGLSLGMGVGAVPVVYLLMGAALSGPWGLILPVVSAFIVLSVCIAQYVTKNQIEKHKPKDSIKEMGDLKSYVGVELNFSDETKNEKTQVESVGRSRDSLFGKKKGMADSEEAATTSFELASGFS